MCLKSFYKHRYIVSTGKQAPYTYRPGLHFIKLLLHHSENLLTSSAAGSIIVLRHRNNNYAVISLCTCETRDSFPTHTHL